MQKLLIAREKHGNRYFDISTPELKAKVFLFLFKEREAEKTWYIEARGGNKVTSEQKKFYMAARKGSAIDAEYFLRTRSRDRYEYEELWEEALSTPE